MLLMSLNLPLHDGKQFGRGVLVLSWQSPGGLLVVSLFGLLVVSWWSPGSRRPGGRGRASAAVVLVGLLTISWCSLVLAVSGWSHGISW